MTNERAQLIEMAARRIHPDYTPVLERLVECDGGDWYLREKIIKAPDTDSLTANGRVLKYANCFVEGGARVTFVREGPAKTPDLWALVNGTAFFLEVRRFRMNEQVPTRHPALKIVDAVVAKRSQLPDSDVGFVAIDNFDLFLESGDERGFTHEHIVDGLTELERRSRSNPEEWRQPSGVILKAMSSGGASSVMPRIPHFVWVNSASARPSSASLVRWITSALPDGEIFDATVEAEALET